MASDNKKLYQKFWFGDLEVNLLTNEQPRDCVLLNKLSPIEKVETCYNHKVEAVEYFWGGVRVSENETAVTGIHYYNNNEAKLLLETLYSYIFELNSRIYSISITQNFHEVFTRLDEIQYNSGEPILDNIEIIPYPMLNYYKVPNGIIMVGFEVDTEQGWAFYFDGSSLTKLLTKGNLTKYRAPTK